MISRWITNEKPTLPLVSSHNYSAIFHLDDLFIIFQRNYTCYSAMQTDQIIFISTVSFIVVGQAANSTANSDKRTNDMLHKDRFGSLFFLFRSIFFFL